MATWSMATPILKIGAKQKSEQFFCKPLGIKSGLVLAIWICVLVNKCLDFCVGEGMLVFMVALDVDTAGVGWYCDLDLCIGERMFGFLFR